MTLQIGGVYLTRINLNNGANKTHIMVRILFVKSMGANRHPLYLYETECQIGCGVEPSINLMAEDGRHVDLVSSFFYDKSLNSDMQALYKSLGFTQFATSPSSFY